MATIFTAKKIEEIILSSLGHSPVLGQISACESISKFIIRFRENVGFVLAGYAGTGKTTLVGAIVKALPSLNIQTILLAPTGRAAKVLSAYSGQEAYTIHKYIYYSGVDEYGAFKMSLRKNKLRNILFIVDEASMMSADDNLLSNLYEFVYSGYQCRLMFIGDTAQLPPVGSSQSPALNVDFLESRFGVEMLQTELTQVLRQKKMSSILENATILRLRLEEENFLLPIFSFFSVDPSVVDPILVNDNLSDNSTLSDPSEHSNFNAPSEIIKDLCLLQSEDFEEALQSSYGKYKKEEVVFITKSNKRANMFNKNIRERVLCLEEELSAGDLLMIVKNNYYWTEKMPDVGFLANGEMIEVLKVKKHQELYGFRFADVEVRLVDYPLVKPFEMKVCLDCLHVDGPSLPYTESQKLWDAVMLDYANLKTKSKKIAAVKQNPFVNALQVKYAYALTCHKTQGGQWPLVFIDLGYFTDDMLNSDFLRWLYTALTRGMEKVYLLGFDEKWVEKN